MLAPLSTVGCTCLRCLRRLHENISHMAVKAAALLLAACDSAIAAAASLPTSHALLEPAFGSWEDVARGTRLASREPAAFGWKASAFEVDRAMELAAVPGASYVYVPGECASVDIYQAVAGDPTDYATSPQNVALFIICILIGASLLLVGVYTPGAALAVAFGTTLFLGACRVAPLPLPNRPPGSPIKLATFFY